LSTHARPEELTLSVEREDVPGTCPECGAAALKQYPVVGERGWLQVVKCQECLHSVSRERWHRLGPITLLSDSI
jgi:hypothetical protein